MYIHLHGYIRTHAALMCGLKATRIKEVRSPVLGVPAKRRPETSENGTHSGLGGMTIGYEYSLEKQNLGPNAL